MLAQARDIHELDIPMTHIFGTPQRLRPLQGRLRMKVRRNCGRLTVIAVKSFRDSGQYRAENARVDRTYTQRPAKKR